MLVVAQALVQVEARAQVPVVIQALELAMAQVRVPARVGPG